MVTAAQMAALIAAIAFAVLAAAGVYTLIKFSRLISAASRAIADWQADSELLLGQACSAVERAREQLVRTDEIAANLDEVSTNMAELTTDLSLLTRAVHAVVGGPLGRAAAVTFGFRRAVALRRTGASAPALTAGGKKVAR